MKKKPTYIDLFCGAGGFSIGFDQMGFENLFSVDIEPSFCETYRTNFPKHNLIQDNIANLTAKQINKYTNGKSIDIVIGGPPC
jgi:DNA (cytosine-5)-methyltransferase 1